MNSHALPEPVCSFCLSSSNQVRRLIAGPEGVYICSECVALCNEMLAESEAQTPESVPLFVGNLLSPAAIREYLDRHVVGQGQAKRVLSVAVYNHYKRIDHPVGPATAEPELEKSNILLVGPTGSGKTLLARTLAQVLDVPFCMVDATSLTEAGYVGDDVETILQRLIQAADYDLARAARGIVYIDEIDKIARKSGAASAPTRDVSGEGVQQALLKIVEGALVSVPQPAGRAHPAGGSVHLDTRHVLFIVGGSFDGLVELAARRRSSRNSIGFAAGREREAEPAGPPEIIPDDLVRFGILPELAGRFPVVAALQSLDRPALMRVLVEPNNALLRQFRQLLAWDGVELEFSQDALELVADEALRRGVGARGLRAIVETILLDAMYAIPSYPEIARVLVDGDAARHKRHPLLLGQRGQVLPWPDDTE